MSLVFHRTRPSKDFISTEVRAMSLMSIMQPFAFLGAGVMVEVLKQVNNAVLNMSVNSGDS